MFIIWLFFFKKNVYDHDGDSRSLDLKRPLGNINDRCLSDQRDELDYFCHAFYPTYE